MSNDRRWDTNVAALFGRVLASDRLGHAYVLVAPENGTAEATARAVAARLLCLEPAGTRDFACGACRSCQLLERDLHPDLAVVAAPPDKSGIVIDQVRELEMALAPVPDLAPRRVAIILDAESMNDHAANALLKTLEEPPGRSVLLLTVRRVRALLPTIRSRCQRIHLAGIGADAEPAGRDDSPEHAALPVEDILAGRLDAHEVPARVLGSTTGAEARERAHRALDGAAWTLRNALRRAVGAGAEGGSSAPGDDIMRAIDRLWAAGDRVDANVNPGLVLESVAVQLCEQAVGLRGAVSRTPKNISGERYS